MMMSETLVVAEGKTKILQQCSTHPDHVLVRFKDRATAFNAQKVAEVAGKGELNARISAILFQLLEAQGIPTCYVSQGSRPDELVYRKLTMIPLEVVVRNQAWGSLCKRFSKFQPGDALKQPLVEFFYKDDQAGDPLITEPMMVELGVLPASVEPALLTRLTLEANEVFVAFFRSLGIVCADFKLEFGLDPEGNVILGDELSPDNFRLRDAKTGQVLDKDVFRLDLGDVGEAYRQLHERMQGAGESLAMGDGQMHTYEAIISVRYRKNVLHPESRAVLGALHSVGFKEVDTLNAGRSFRLTLTAPHLIEASRRVAAMAEDVLSNPVIETFHIDQLTLKPQEA
jgi:phosphoribosylaminoimidazole-succinocarboxamide synthase